MRKGHYTQAALVESVSLLWLVGVARGPLWRGARFEEIGQIGLKPAPTGPALASAGPDWKYFCGAPLSGVCRHFWGGASSNIHSNHEWCERMRPEKSNTKLGVSGGMLPSFSSPAETFHVCSTDISVKLNKSMGCWTQYLLHGQVPTRITYSDSVEMAWATKMAVNGRFSWASQPPKYICFFVGTATVR